MNKKLILTLALGLLLALTMPVMAQELAKVSKLVRLEGWVVDEPAGAKHANLDSKAAVLEAHENGATLVFVSKAGDIYDMDEQETALEHVGQNWIILGKLDPNGKLKVGSYIDPSKRKGPPPKPAE
jgi:hypothetical protein